MVIHLYNIMLLYLGTRKQKKCTKVFDSKQIHTVIILKINYSALLHCDIINIRGMHLYIDAI